MRVLVRRMAKKLAARYAGHGGGGCAVSWIPGGRCGEHRLGRGPVRYGLGAKAYSEASGDGALRRIRLGRRHGSVPAEFLYALNEALSDIRSFAFSGSLMEVSDILEKQPVEEAITRIMSLIGFGS